MSSSESPFYCDGVTRAALRESGERVLLLGSYGGFSNFGDELQLKGAIAWHRQHTKLEPVLVCHLTAVPDAGFLSRVRRWFGAEHVLFWSSAAVDVGFLGLCELEVAARIAHLHVYGGGFLNRYWGRGVIEQIEALIARFGVGHYVLSGQQVDPELEVELREHFRRYPPRIAGGRDVQSTRLLAACGVEALDSFDDALAPLQDLVQRSRSTPAPQYDLALHLNLSYYTGPDDLPPIAEQLRRVAETVVRRASARAPRVLLLNAYADRRIDEVVDTLSATNLLEDSFPFVRFEALQLGQLSLPYDGAAPRAMLFDAPLVVASSYHVSVLCALMGIPCHLLARNEYYVQKRDGLGLSPDLDAFLANPTPTDLSQRLAQRGAWCARLADVYRQAPAARECDAPPDSISSTRAWQPKPRLVDSVRREATHWQSECRALLRRTGDLEQELRDLRLWVGELEQARSWVESQRAGLEAAITERDCTIEALRARLSQLEQGKHRLEQQRASVAEELERHRNGG